MTDVAPKYQCPDCRRGVLNRRVKHCLYCGAQLPAHVLASEQEIAAAEISAERERKTYELSAPVKAPQQGTWDLNGASDIGNLLGDLF